MKYSKIRNLKKQSRNKTRIPHYNENEIILPQINIKKNSNPCFLELGIVGGLGAT